MFWSLEAVSIAALLWRNYKSLRLLLKSVVGVLVGGWLGSRDAAAQKSSPNHLVGVILCFLLLFFSNDDPNTRREGHSPDSVASLMV